MISSLLAGWLRVIADITCFDGDGGGDGYVDKTTECDIPVPGIAPFGMVLVPVQEKIGPEKKYRNR